MQFLDDAARGIYGPSASGIDPSSPITMAVAALLTSRGGKEYGEGISQLLDRFTHCGHGIIAQSWVDIGGNQPVTPNQLEEASAPQRSTPWRANPAFRARSCSPSSPDTCPTLSIS